MNRDSGCQEEVLTQEMCPHPESPSCPRHIQAEISLKALDFRRAGTGLGWSHLCVGHLQTLLHVRITCKMSRKPASSWNFKAEHPAYFYNLWSSAAAEVGNQEWRVILCGFPQTVGILLKQRLWAASLGQG